MEEFKKRRDLLFDKLEDNSIVIVDCWPEYEMVEGVEYRYRPDSNLYYYTGFTEPNAAMVLEKKGDYRKFTMFVQPKDPSKEVWTGKRWGVDGVKNNFVADEAFTYQELLHQFSEKVNQYEIIYHNIIYHNIPNSENYDYVMKLSNSYKLVNLKPIMERQRVVKTPYEIDLIKKSCQLSGKMHTVLMGGTQPGMNECTLDGLFTGGVMWNGCERLAYPNVVASGNNGTTLHYCNNCSTMKDGQLVLIDAGGELGYYASDITRTYPVNGKFTQEQKDIYNLVLDVQKKCIELVKPGIIFTELHQISCKLITEGLIKLGLLEGGVEDNIKNETYKKFYMHGLGHWMGLDVHDCGTVDRKETPLEPGMIFTIEPGIYISKDCDLPIGLDKYKGIGIRIEDDILCTENGSEVLSSAAPKEVDELEEIVGTKKIDMFNL